MYVYLLERSRKTSKTILITGSCVNTGVAIMEKFASEGWNVVFTGRNCEKVHAADQGIGIEINEEACLKYPYKPHTLRHYTGALTDIRPAKSEFYF